MTSYYQPRWKTTVFFGSFRELNYRIELGTRAQNFFCLRTHSGPGFELELRRFETTPGFTTRGFVPEAARSAWLENASCRDRLCALLAIHFSRVLARPETIVCFCYPGDKDLLPEGHQLNWCLSLVYELWTAVPASERGVMSKAEFMA